MTPAEVKALRKSLGLTQRELGEVFGYAEADARTIRRWESKAATGRAITPIAALLLRYMVRYGLPDEALE